MDRDRQRPWAAWARGVTARFGVFGTLSINILGSSGPLFAITGRPI
jgi:hypothetical protein